MYVAGVIHLVLQAKSIDRHGKRPRQFILRVDEVDCGACGLTSAVVVFYTTSSGFLFAANVFCKYSPQVILLVSLVDANWL